MYSIVIVIKLQKTVSRWRNERILHVARQKCVPVEHDTCTTFWLYRA